MTDLHPITPPPELVKQWLGECFGPIFAGEVSDVKRVLATKAAHWGWQQRDASVDNELQKARDEELEACVEWLGKTQWCEPNGKCLRDLQTARRPKPPSLAEEALAVVKNSAICDHLSSEHETILRHALERLQELENMAFNALHAARRPNSPSLKEQARVELDRLIALIPLEGAIAMAEPIRRALERLQELERGDE